MSSLLDRNAVCDYVITRVLEAGEQLNALKLQKLMYYVQAWNLAFYDEPLFDGKFQAWIHGPVNRQLYDRFASTKSLYSEITESDVTKGFDSSTIPYDKRQDIDGTLEAYAGLTGTQLESMTHREEPWIDARKGLRDSQRCEQDIDEKLMAKFYSNLAADSDGQAW